MTDPTENGEPDDQEQASQLRENTDNDSSGVTRRAVIGGSIAILGTGGWLAYAVERAKAAVVGNVGTSANPYEHAYVDRVVFEARTSDPSSPDDGTLWYNESA